MNVHAKNLLNYFGVIEKKVTLTNAIYDKLKANEKENRKFDSTSGAISRIKMKKRDKENGGRGGGAAKKTTRVPYNYARIKDNERIQRKAADTITEYSSGREVVNKIECVIIVIFIVSRR